MLSYVQVETIQGHPSCGMLSLKYCLEKEFRIKALARYIIYNLQKVFFAPRKDEKADDRGCLTEARVANFNWEEGCIMT